MSVMPCRSRPNTTRRCKHRGGVVEVHDGARRADQRLVRALDQFVPALREHLDSHVVGDEVFLDQLAHEVEVGLAGATGNPTSISLKPIATSVSNMRRFRTGSIGSISAWLPSRRSTAHQRGALVSLRSGHSGQAARAARTRWYFSNGIFFGCAGSGGMCSSLVLGGGGLIRKCKKLPTQKGQELRRTPMSALAYMRRRRVANKDVTR